MSERLKFAKQIVDEYRAMRDAEPIPVPAEIDTVWVLSGHGNALKSQKTGIFGGRFMDKERILAGIELVKKITAARLGKDPSEITKGDMVNNAPILLYNGEPEQNEALKRYMEQEAENFPLPNERVAILELPEMYTPGQIKSFGEYSTTHHPKNVAIVSHAPRIPRIGRYLHHYQGQLPTGVHYFAYLVRETSVPVGATLGEIRRIVTYANKDVPDLSRTSVDFTHVR